MTTTSTPFPQTVAAVTGTTARFVTPTGDVETLRADVGDDIRQVIVARATEQARRTGTTVELRTVGDHGEHRLLVGPDGTISPATPAAPKPAVERELALTDETDPRLAGDATATPRRPSFIATPDTPAAPRHRGWLARLGVGPAPGEVARMRLLQAISRQWAGCRPVAVVNGKGGVGKTMTTAMLASVFARHGGGHVLAWDNNDTRGTLGWRTEPGLYDATIRDLLSAAPTLLARGAGVSDIARFVHHQDADRYDVLRSNPELLAADQRLTHAEFDQLMQVASRYFRMVIFDSGNDESADRWLRMIDWAHQLVIPTLTTPESAESAALLLEALRQRDPHSAHLADTAVIVVTQTQATTRRELVRTADGFAGHVRTVETVPYDPALKAGPLRFDALRPTTRDAWLRVGAATAAGL